MEKTNKALSLGASEGNTCLSSSVSGRIYGGEKLGLRLKGEKHLSGGREGKRGHSGHGTGL